MRQQPHGKVIRVAILDDHEVVLRGVVHLLEATPDTEVTGFSSRTPDFIALLRSERCDVALVDFLLSGDEMDGLNLVKFLRIRFPNTKIMVFPGMTTPLLSIFRCARG